MWRCLIDVILQCIFILLQMRSSSSCKSSNPHWVTGNSTDGVCIHSVDNEITASTPNYRPARWWHPMAIALQHALMRWPSEAVRVDVSLLMVKRTATVQTRAAAASSWICVLLALIATGLAVLVSCATLLPNEMHSSLTSALNNCLSVCFLRDTSTFVGTGYCY